MEREKDSRLFQALNHSIENRIVPSTSMAKTYGNISLRPNQVLNIQINQKVKMNRQPNKKIKSKLNTEKSEAKTVESSNQEPNGGDLMESQLRELIKRRVKD